MAMYNVLILDSEELNDFDMKTGNIGVDKSIFDNFIKNALVSIHFIDDKMENRICQYEMIFEDNDTIFMRYLWDEFI